MYHAPKFPFICGKFISIENVDALKLFLTNVHATSDAPGNIIILCK